ncbi:hypothetical protein Y032_0306g1998 [Ancylostoma ceylanicum]|uniref:Uncharacterized protein n=1 Tax=Ancylostoma ceylanicum TaxID=53326 RepID=A0A016S304_9BILA|nr:hypothetical protein Y032_0306g1998 [Ancylostoma ceylanicum]
MLDDGNTHVSIPPSTNGMEEVQIQVRGNPVSLDLLRGVEHLLTLPARSIHPGINHASTSRVHFILLRVLRRGRYGIRSLVDTLSLIYMSIHSILKRS